MGGRQAGPVSESPHTLVLQLTHTPPAFAICFTVTPFLTFTIFDHHTHVPQEAFCKPRGRAGGRAEAAGPRLTRTPAQVRALPGPAPGPRRAPDPQYEASTFCGPKSLTRQDGGARGGGQSGSGIPLRRPESAREEGQREPWARVL